MKSPLLKKGKGYKKMGLRPLPLGQSLHPWIDWREFRHREPTDDELEKWFTDPKTIGIGLITGRVGDLPILSIDVDHKHGKNGWEALGEHGIKRLKAPTVHTQTNDGAHGIYRHPDTHVPSFEPMYGVEVKADGAMIVVDAPGYEWDDEWNLDEDTEIPPLPKKLLELITSSPKMRIAVRAASDESEIIEIDEEPEEEEQEAESVSIGAAIPESGYIADYVRFASRVTMTPPEFALVVALAQLSIIMNGKVVLPGFGGRPEPPAVWAVLIGHPGSLKSTAIQNGLSIVDRVAKKRAIPPHTTPEALMEFLEKQNHGYLFHTELSGFMKKSAKRGHQAGDKELLNEIYDFKPQVSRNTIGGGIRTARYPAVTLLGATTFNNFTEYAESGDVRGGFLCRMLFVVQESRPEYRGLMDATKRNPDRIVSALRELYSLVREAPKDGVDEERWVHMSIDRKAKRAFDHWDQMMRETEVDPVLAGLYERAGGIALRLSMSYALSRGSLEIRAEDVGHATALLDWVRATAWPLIGDIAGTGTYAGRQMLKIKQQTQRLMKKRAARIGAGADWAEQWVNRRDVQQPCKIPKDQMVKWVASLVETGEMVERTGVGRNGRKVAQVRLMRRGWIADYEIRP